MRRAWLLACALIGLLVATTAQAQVGFCPPPLPAVSAAEAPRDRGLLWKATRDGRSVYLFGTLHIGKPQWRRLGPVTAAALRASDVLALEVDPNDPELLKAMAELRHPEALPPALQQRLNNAFARACLATESLAALHPVLQATTLTVMEARWLGMDTAYAMEQVLLTHARTLGPPGRKVISLESPVAQLHALVPGSDAETAEVLEQGLAQLEDKSARRVLEKLSIAWESGDLEALEDYSRWCECTHNADDQAFMRRLNDERNEGLAKAIEIQHRIGRRVFAAVGALHMTGPMSLPKLLEQRGFRVERVVFRR